MSFVVNGADWRFHADPGPAIAQALEKFFDFAGVSKERGESIEFGDDFQTRKMCGDFTLWDLFAPGSGLGLSGDIQQELAVWLASDKRYLDGSDWPAGAHEIAVSVQGGVQEENADVAWVHHCVRAGRSVACFTIGDSAVLETKTSVGVATVHFVADDKGRRQFWRDAVVRQGDDAESLRRNAAHAFPDVLFVAGVLDGLNHLAGGYSALRGRILATFEVLDDRGGWIFTCPPPVRTPDERPLPTSRELPPNQLIEARFRAAGIHGAPENPNVRLHRRSREARETMLGSRTLYCEWHVKLEPHRNRVHLHAPVPESNGKVVVAVIAEHLPLPGD